MSDINTYNTNSSSNHGSKRLSNSNTICVDIETADNNRQVLEAQEQKETVIIGDGQADIINIAKMYECLEGWPRPTHQNVIWVQLLGVNRDQIEPNGAALNYDPDSRNGFVKLVFFLVFIMLLITAGFVTFVLMSDPVKDVFRSYGLFMTLGATIVVLFVSYAMACTSCARQIPCNFVCLALTTVCMSIIAAYITSRYETQTVLLAILATTVVVFVCLLLACSRFDFTKYMLYVVVIAAAFGAIAMVASLTMLLTSTYLKPLHLVLLIVGTLIQVVLLTMELQMILGGKTVELGEDDYALAAFMLYTSIIDIFLKMVQLLGFLEN